MPDPIHLIPIDAIDEAALARDRTALDPAAQQELLLSIAKGELRMPIEVWELSEPREAHRYGLISGYRRLSAYRQLHETALEKDRYTAIPAFIRKPASIVAAFASMVEENAIRAEISPWEQAMLAVTARDEQIFPSIEEAIETLYPNFGFAKRKRLRSLAHTAEELAGCLTDPEQLSLRQLLRLASAVARGFRDVIRHALLESSLKDPASQWQILLPVLAEAETSEPGDPDQSVYNLRPGRPRRLLTPRRGVNIRREKTRDGWCLHFTGREATGPLMDLVLDEIERMYSPG